MDSLRLTIETDLSRIDAQQWDALAGDPPFLRHAFLCALRAPGCASPAAGWAPQDLAVGRGGALAALGANQPSVPLTRCSWLARTSVAPRSSHIRRGKDFSQRFRLAASVKRSTICYWSPPSGGCSTPDPRKPGNPAARISPWRIQDRNSL
ncbi:hypothetical protein G6F57_019475 [Rhizopus arrhizus]|nr:hypothetical protein G6F57_019475 [Rhizopus arrhizus]